MSIVKYSLGKRRELKPLYVFATIIKGLLILLLHILININKLNLKNSFIRSPFYDFILNITFTF